MNPFTTSGFFVLRTPLFPFEEFLALSEGLTFAQALRGDGDLAASTVADRKLLRARLLKLLERSEVQEALWLASPEFLEALSLWKKEPESAKGQKLERTLYRYVARMTSRPTPFGLFAGCTVGTIGGETCLQIGPRDQYWRRSRLDMEYLFNLGEATSSEPSLQGCLAFRPNTSLYLAAGRYHHAQSYISNDARCYRLVATEPTPYLTATLERASTGATAQALAVALVKDDPDTSAEEAEQYVRQLIDTQVLVSDLSPPITGPQPIADMIAQVNRPETASVKTALCSVSQHLHELDEAGVGNDLRAYVEIVNTISKLPAAFKPEHLVQVDMMKPATNVTLDQLLIRDILRGVEVLRSLGGPWEADAFKQFKEDFRERYQEQEVPLVLALDDEVGIGFQRKDLPDAREPLLDEIDFSAADEKSESKVRKSEFILLRKLQELALEKKTILDLDSKLLEALRAKNPPPLPDAFAVMLQVIIPAGGGKPSVLLQSFTGPSGALLLGRFCCADDQLTAYVREHLRAEEAHRTGEGVIYAEVLHLPEGRTGNVIFRPMLRDYEIPFLATSRAPQEHQIPVTDLMVSIRNDRVVLRSQRLGREVVPRLTSAHGYVYPRNLKLYTFLCLLQTQGLTASASWSWGILEEAAVLPRVVLDNIVLAPARWRMSKEEIEQLSREQGPQRLKKIDEWRTRLGMPRFVLLADADNQLLIDFENVLSVETLIEYIKNRQNAQLVEMFPGPENLSVRGPEGSFTHELVIPFIRKLPAMQEVKAPAIIHEAAQIADAERTFLPGSEWLFAKIYCSPSQLDRLLLEQVKPVMEKIMIAGEADSWFFIRYADPHLHLRLRIRGRPKTLTAHVLPQLWERLDRQRRQGKAWRVQLDTYERELERYGGPAGMQIAERLFQFDSELVLDQLAAISEDLGGKIRWHLGFLGVDALLACLGFDLSVRREIVDGLRRFHEKDFAVNHNYKKQLSKKFHAERAALEKLLEPSPGDLPQAALDGLRRFAPRAQQIRTELESLQQKGELTRAVPELAGSYVHMHLNRMLRSAANLQEMVLYDFLARIYESKLARGNQRISDPDR